jgi:tight adherence protein B
VIGLLLAAAAATGAFYLGTAVLFGWRGVGLGPRPARLHARRRTRRAGLGRADRAVGGERRQLAVTSSALAAGGGLVGVAVFGGPLAGLALAAFAGAVPVASARVRAAERRSAAQEAWPRLLEEVRILTTSLGRSVPQALFEAGRDAPETIRPAFDAARREWLLSTDFGRTDLDRRLAALIEDRILDVQGRKDARARQAGVRFARRFTLVVPLGMALVGMSIGNGRQAYATPGGQVLVVVGIGAVVVCWWWAGRLLALPVEQRVFHA